MREFIDAQKARLGLRSHSEFARRVGVERETVSRWYNTGQLPSPETAEQIAAALEIDPEDVPHYDPRGTSPKAAALLAQEVAELRARMKALEAAAPSQRSAERHPLDDLIDYLNQQILTETKLTALDMLDALASTGTRVVADPDGGSTRDYYQRLGTPEPDTD